MLDVIDLIKEGVSSEAAQSVLNPIYAALGTYLAAKAAPVLRSLSGSKNTFRLGAPEELPHAVRSGQARPGQFVEGTGYFSLLTVAHLAPEMQVHTHTQQLASTLLFGAPAGPLIHTHPVTSLPVHGTTRVAFLYPEHMWGFADAKPSDGTPRTLPFMGRQILLVGENDWDHLVDRIVQFRARVMVLSADDLKTALPEYSDDLYDEFRRGGALTFLDAQDDGCWVRDYTRPPANELIGAHYLAVHWDISLDSSQTRFVDAIGGGVAEACRQLGHIVVPARLTSGMGDDKGANAWASPTGFQVYQPPSGAVLRMQMNTDFRSAARRSESTEQFSILTSNVIRSVESAHSIRRDKIDADCTDQRDAPNLTILQSTAARKIDADPVLAGVRAVLEKK